MSVLSKMQRLTIDSDKDSGFDECGIYEETRKKGIIARINAFTSNIM